VYRATEAALKVTRDPSWAVQMICAPLAPQVTSHNPLSAVL
jgi:hypothetical protein